MPEGDQPGGRTKTYVRLYVCTYVRSCSRSSSARRVDFTYRDRYVRTYERKQFAFRRRFHPRMYVRTYAYFLKPQAVPNDTYVHTCVRINYRARAAKHYVRYVRTYLRTYRVAPYVLAYLRTHVTCRLRYPGTLPFHLRTYVRTSTYVRTVSPIHTCVPYVPFHPRTVRAACHCFHAFPVRQGQVRGDREWHDAGAPPPEATGSGQD